MTSGGRAYRNLYVKPLNPGDKVVHLKQNWTIDQKVEESHLLIIRDEDKKSKLVHASEITYKE